MVHVGEGAAAPGSNEDTWFDERWWGVLTWDIIATPYGERINVTRADEHIILHREMLVSIDVEKPQGLYLDKRAEGFYFVVDAINGRFVYVMTLKHRLVDAVEAHRLA